MSETIDNRSHAHLAFSARWASDDMHHTDIRHFERFNVWRDLDLLPPSLQQAILGQRAGHRERHPFAAGELVEPWREGRVITLPEPQVDLRLRNGMRITPRDGRFYPRGIIHGHAGIFSEDMHPLRYLGSDGGQQRFDLNHPLARYPLEVGVEVIAINEAGDEHGGRCSEALAELLHHPGMKVPHPEVSTDLLSGTPFARPDEGSDDRFYGMPRLVHHLDAAARERVSALYGELLHPGMRVLDLMASWDSHLPDALSDIELVGLGMNGEELAANPRLLERRVHDLNAEPRLPWPDGHFDAVICTASVEYLTDPLATFREVARVLKPGGRFINLFSNRWFPPKATAIWSELHEFERPALVADYYRMSGAFGDLHSYSEVGLPRPLDDPHIRQSFLSDPLHGIWGHRLD